MHEKLLKHLDDVDKIQQQLFREESTLAKIPYHKAVLDRRYANGEVPFIADLDVIPIAQPRSVARRLRGKQPRRDTSAKLCGELELVCSRERRHSTCKALDRPIHGGELWQNEAR